jgi:hypothetical protein
MISKYEIKEYQDPIGLIYQIHVGRGLKKVSKKSYKGSGVMVGNFGCGWGKSFGSGINAQKGIGGSGEGRALGALKSGLRWAVI